MTKGCRKQSSLIAASERSERADSGRMNDERLPKKMLFGELRKRRPCHGTKRRWRDVAAVDLQALGAKEEWYKKLYQDRKKWFECCRAGVNEVASCRKKNTCAANRVLRKSICVCLWEKFPMPK